MSQDNATDWPSLTSCKLRNQVSGDTYLIESIAAENLEARERETDEMVYLSRRDLNTGAWEVVE